MTADRPKKPKRKPANPWPRRLKKLRDGLGLSNDGVAARLGIPVRLWQSWLYGERNPSPAGVALVKLLEQGRIKD